MSVYEYPAGYPDSKDFSGGVKDRVKEWARREPRTAVVDLTNAQIKALRATPKELVAAQGAGTLIEIVSAKLILDYGSNVLTESTDNLILGYNNAATQIGETIESTGFIDAAADTVTNWFGKKDDIVAAASAVNKNVCLKNSGDGEFSGNAGNDTTMRVIVRYIVHADLSL